MKGGTYTFPHLNANSNPTFAGLTLTGDLVMSDGAETISMSETGATAQRLQMFNSVGGVSFRMLGDGNIVFSQLDNEAAVEETFLSFIRNAETRFHFNGTQVAGTTAEGLAILVINSGATQGASGAVANELWKTASHATLPDNVILIGV